MTELERHIAKLLLDNDCVIVPGFGGFMAHHIAASYDEKNHIFLPPTRTVGFNPRLTMNDSVLAQDYVSCYDLSYPEALKRIESEVDEFRQMILGEDGGHELCGIGRLYALENGEYDFIPNDNGITTPATYGFQAFELDALPATESAPESAPAASAADIRKTEPSPFAAYSPIAEAAPSPAHNEEEEAEQPTLSINIPVKMLRHMAAACIVLFVMLSIPSRLGDASTGTTSQSAIDAKWLYKIMPKEMTSGKPESLVASEEAAKAKADGQADESDALPYYTIVLASRVSLKNAQHYVDKLHQQGMTEASVCRHNGFTKVIYRKFASRAEANSALSQLKADSSFADSWITEIKQNDRQ
ncbi:HU domain-containing protein [Prevotella sp.]|uniref:HU domain-containing protein n=1 Tax=Prevotella sp. TaxID=59823 RepID=UPI00307CAA39